MLYSSQLLINRRRLYPHWFEIDTARLYVNCMVPSRPYELILVLINEDTGAVVRKSNAVVSSFYTVVLPFLTLNLIKDIQIQWR